MTPDIHHRTGNGSTSSCGATEGFSTQNWRAVTCRACLRSLDESDTVPIVLPKRAKGDEAS